MKQLVIKKKWDKKVRDIADKIVCMRSGKKVFDGTTEEFQSVNDDKNFNEIFMELVDE